MAHTNLGEMNLDAKQALVIVNVEDMKGNNHQIVLYEGSKKEIKNVLDNFKADIEEKEKEALFELIQRKVTAALAQRKKTVKNLQAIKRPASSKVDSRKEQSTPERSDHPSVKEPQKRPYRTRDQLKEMHKNDERERIFQRLWYDATEGRKKRKEEYEKWFRVNHPFKPTLVSRQMVDNGMNYNSFHERLAYSHLNRYKTEDCHVKSQESQISKRSANTEKKNSKDLFLHSQKRANKVLEQLLQNLQKSKPREKNEEDDLSKYENNRFESEIFKFYTGEEGKKASSLFNSSLEKSVKPIHKGEITREKVIELRDVNKGRGIGNMKERGIFSGSVRNNESSCWEKTIRYHPDPSSLNFVMPRRYKKMLGIE